MKKIIVFILIALSIICFTACDKKEEISIYVVDGTPSLVVSNLLDTEVDGKKISVHFVSGVDVLTASLINKDADFAVLPVNQAAQLYNGGVEIKLLSVNITGSLYILGGALSELNGLKGKRVYNVGRGGTPDVTFKRILYENNIEYSEEEEREKGKVNLKYVSAAGGAAEIIAAFESGKCDYAILSEPAVTQVINKVKADTGNTLQISLSMKELWEKSSGVYTQAGVIVRDEFLNNNKKAVELIYDLLLGTPEYLSNNADKVLKDLQKAGSSFKTELTDEIIKRSNVVALRASLVKSDVENYLGVLGVPLPKEEFYVSL